MDLLKKKLKDILDGFNSGNTLPQNRQIVSPVSQSKVVQTQPKQQSNWFVQGVKDLPASVKILAKNTPGAINDLVIKPQQSADWARQSADIAGKKIPGFKEVGNFAANSAQTFGQGLQNMAVGFDAATKKDAGAWDRAKGVSKLALGAGQTLAPFTGPYQLSNAASSLPQSNNKVLNSAQRFSAGVVRGIGQDDTLSPHIKKKDTIKFKIGSEEIGIDPFETAGQMVGFVKNPTNSQLFKLTEKIFKTGKITQAENLKKWLTTTALRGSAENILLDIGNMPDDATPAEKVAFMLKSATGGAVSEVAGRGGLDIAGAAGKRMYDSKLAEKAFDELKEVWRKTNMPVQTMQFDKNGERIVMPMWRYHLQNQSGYIKPDEFVPKGKIKIKKPNADVQITHNPLNTVESGGEILPSRLQTGAPEANTTISTNVPSSNGIIPQLPSGDKLALPEGTIKVNTAKQARMKIRQLHTQGKNTQVEIVPKETGGTGVITDQPGEPIIVNTTTQAKRVLSQYPNANIRIELKTGKIPINMPEGKIPTPDEVRTTLPQKTESFIQRVLGYSTIDPTGGSKQVNVWTRTLRGGQENITRRVEEGLGSENALIRNTASILQSFFRGLGMSPERANASMQLRGEMGTANERAYNIMESLYKSLNYDKNSLERINAVLDPELAKVKVSFDELTPVEKQVYGIIREGLDLVHDTSYANGHISTELYVKNKGNYTPRMYEVMEMPAEVNKFVKQGKKIQNDLYKKREGLDEWKIDNSLNDPVYALGKRLAQVETNSAIKKYTDFLASNARFVSDSERPGFTKLSDSPAYGSLKGKYVLNSAAEDLKGFFFSNQALQNLYDVFRAYDRMGIRQLQKKLLTVFNPTTNVGNIVSDQVFGFLTGIDPLTLNKNLIEVMSNPAKYKQLSDYLMRKGIVGTDITRTDFVNKLSQIDDLGQGKRPGKVKSAINKVESFYGGTDDAYKIAAFQSLLNKGYSLEEATRKVADGFQNYANVGKFYDVAAKTPLIGKPFIKFQGDLIRIIKNGAVNNPLGLIAFLGTLYGVARLTSKLSGESDEDRITRENRFAAPMIPILNIPLTWQTPIGEINVARYISPFYANNETTSLSSNMLPFVPDINTDKDVAANIAMNTNDPLLSPFVQLAVNRDFRGKPISDPNENKYQPSTLTPQEKLVNQGIFIGRQYTPPPINSTIDVFNAAQGRPNMYGTPQTTGQALARLAGVKISQYGPEEVQEIRDRDAEFTQKGNDAIDSQINSIHKQQLKGEITPEQAQKRIEYLQSQKKPVNQTKKTQSEVIRWLNENGELESVDLTRQLEAKQGIDAFKQDTTNAQNARKIWGAPNDQISNEEKEAAFKQLGFTWDEVRYDYMSSDKFSNDERTAYIVSKNMTKEQLIERILSGRRESVSGNMFVKDGVIDNLKDMGILTAAEAKYYKSIKYDKNGNQKPSKGGSGKKLKLGSTPKVKIEQSKPVSMPSVNFTNVMKSEPLNLAPRRQTAKPTGKVRLKTLTPVKMKIKPTYYQGLK